MATKKYLSTDLRFFFLFASPPTALIEGKVMLQVPSGGELISEINRQETRIPL